MDKSVIYELFKEKLNEAPNADAVFDEERSLTRKESDMLIDTIASKIPETAHRVGIIMDHTVEMIAAVFAVLKCGRLAFHLYINRIASVIFKLWGK